MVEYMFDLRGPSGHEATWGTDPFGRVPSAVAPDRSAGRGRGASERQRRAAAREGGRGRFR